ncbi:hypothetical protein LTR36_001387 [Oleoguttula mirabilis]|uniref:AB hydrolase-1 domain-containing protein n=1 Tax=Oleoguttula mirabilis TaxID=1507867 RepID=A0AAV9JPC1_9PEZI|nr:hypothetical protein LTR36_001387 [Oleoguttula mirabilis]
MDVFKSLLRQLDLQDRRALRLAIAGPLVAYIGTRIIETLVLARRRHSTKVLASPRQSLQLLSAQKLEDLPYPPNALPGARDVDSPYGNIRVYEWGPEDGRKVLLVHGISTPCISLAGVATLLVEKGCRVMLFDLFGRGYSDAPDPDLYPQNIELFTAQILCVTSSSKLPWGAAGRFTMVGYSLGGGISAAFTSYFPELVEGLVLIAPSGLLRPKHISLSSKLIYGNLLPQTFVEYYVARRMRGSPRAPASSGNPETTKDDKTGVAEVAESETPAHPAYAANSVSLIFPDRPMISPAHAVAWQIDAHPGFVGAFISSIKHAPISGEHERWKLIGSRQSAQRAPSQAQRGQTLKEGKVLVLLGRQDSVIVADEIDEDAKGTMGEGNVEVVKFEGAHDLPIVNAEGCVDAIAAFWGNAGLSKSA